MSLLLSCSPQCHISTILVRLAFTILVIHVDLYVFLSKKTTHECILFSSIFLGKTRIHLCNLTIYRHLSNLWIFSAVLKRHLFNLFTFICCFHLMLIFLSYFFWMILQSNSIIMKLRLSTSMLLDDFLLKNLSWRTLFDSTLPLFFFLWSCLNIHLWYFWYFSYEL